MNIAVCLGSLFSPGSDHIEDQLAEILIQLGLQKPEHRFFIISDLQIRGKFSFSPNIEVKDVGIRGKGGMIKKYLWDLKVSKILKKIKPGIIISYDRLSSFSLKIPQILFVTEGSKVNVSSLKKAKLIAVISQSHKDDLAKTNNIKEEKIVPVFAFANEMYKPATEQVKEQIKEKYCEGKEYFLFTGKNINSETFVDLLKSFSHFKKRQQSSMKLMIQASPDQKSLKSLLTYKHRNDVVIIKKISIPEAAAITGSSYAAIISQSDTQPILNTLNALQSKVPVIASTHPAIQEIAGEAVLYIESESGKELGDKMIRIYTDEKLRDQQIRKGSVIVKNFSADRTAVRLWSCMEEAVK